MTRSSRNGLTASQRRDDALPISIAGPIEMGQPAAARAETEAPQLPSLATDSSW